MHINDSHAIKAFEKHLWQLILNSVRWMRAELNKMLTLLLILLHSLAAAFALAVIKTKQNQEHWFHIILFTYNQCKYLHSITILIHKLVVLGGFFLDVLLTCHAHVMYQTVLPSPGFKQTACFVLPVLRHSEQLLQVCHGFLHRWMRSQSNSLVNEPPHGLQCQGSGLSSSLLHSFHPACLFQPHSQARQLRQLHVKVEADVQQVLDLTDTGNLICQHLCTVLLEIFNAIQELLKKDRNTIIQRTKKSFYTHFLSHVGVNLTI